MYKIVHTIGNIQPGGDKGGLAVAAEASIPLMVRRLARSPTKRGMAMEIRKVLDLKFKKPPVDSNQMVDVISVCLYKICVKTKDYDSVAECYGTQCFIYKNVRRENIMFREIRRVKQRITTEQCVKVLKEEPRGILSIHGEDGYPYGFPMNHFYDEKEHKIYFHCAKVGHKIDAIDRDNRVSFCVYDQGYRKDGEWPLNIQSVIVFGKIKKVLDPNVVMEKVRNLGLKHYPTEESVEEVMKKAISRVELLELSIDHMTGKLVNES